MNRPEVVELYTRAGPQVVELYQRGPAGPPGQGVASGTWQFHTIALATAAAADGNIPANIDYLEVLTYGGQDDGHGRYKKVDTEPAHEGKFPNVDGKWWEYIPENGYARVSHFGTGIAALTKAWTVSKKVICTSGETYTIGVGQSLISDGEDVDIQGPLSTFISAGPQAVFRLRGGWDNIQTPTACAADNWTVPDASVYKRGDVLKVAEPNTPLWHYINGSGRQGEFIVVASVTSTVVTFANPTVYTYDPTRAPLIGKIRDNTCRIDVGTLKVDPANLPTADAALCFAEAFRSPDIRIRSAPLLWENLINALSCYSGTIVVDDAASMTGSFAYCISLNNSEYVHAQVKNSRNLWTVTDGVAQAVTGRGTELSLYGHVGHNVIHDSVSHGSWRTPFAFHHGVWRNRRINCQSFGALAAGFAERGMYTENIDCRSVGDFNGGGGGGNAPGAIGVYAGRAAHDAEASGFVYISTNGAAGVGNPVAYVHGTGAGVWGTAKPYTGPLDVKYATAGATGGSRWINFEVVEPKAEYMDWSQGGGDVVVDGFSFEAAMPPAATLSKLIGMSASGSLTLRNGRIVDSRDISGRAIVTNGAETDIHNVDFVLNGTLTSFSLITDNTPSPGKLKLYDVRVSSLSNVQSLWESATGAVLPTAGSQIGAVSMTLASAWFAGFTDTEIAGLVTATLWRQGIALSPALASNQLNLNDDTVGSFPVNGAALVSLTCGVFGPPSPQGTLAAKATTTGTLWCVALTMRDPTGIVVSNTPITTVGAAVDGSITISPNNDGNLYIVNRSGNSRRIGYAIVAPV